MKKIILPVAVIMIGVHGFSQVNPTKTTTNQKPPVKPVTKPTPAKPQPVMKDLVDSASYAFGIYTVNTFRQYGITKMNSSMVARAIDDLLGKKPSLLSDSAANASISNYINEMQKEKSKATIEAGEKFLAENKKRQGVNTTPTGVQYEVLTQGTGPIATLKDTVICHYKGLYIDGTVFNNSYVGAGPVSFAVSGVIAGWTEILQLMPVGSKWKVYVPYQRGYGVNDYNSIPGGSALIFEIELLGIKGK